MGAQSPAPAAAETILSILLTSCWPARMLSAETMMKGIMGNRKRLLNVRLSCIFDHVGSLTNQYKTISDVGITVDFSIIKGHTSN